MKYIRIEDSDKGVHYINSDNFVRVFSHEPSKDSYIELLSSDRAGQSNLIYIDRPLEIVMAEMRNQQ